MLASVGVGVGVFSPGVSCLLSRYWWMREKGNKLPGLRGESPL